MDLTNLKQTFLNLHHDKKDMYFFAEQVKVKDYSAGFIVSKKRKSVKVEEQTHFTPNCFDWKSKTQTRENIRLIRMIGIDVDLSLDTPTEKTRKEYLIFLDKKCEELEIEPFSILITPHGFHILFLLKYYGKSEDIELIEDTEKKLQEKLEADLSHSGVNALYRLPQKNLDVFYISGKQNIDSYGKIICSDLIKRIKVPKKRSGLTRKGKADWVMEEGFRNNTAFTLALMCKDYGKNRDFTINLINNLGGCETQGETSGTVASAFKRDFHATNDWVRRLCLGENVGQVVRRFGINPKPEYKREYVRKTKTESELKICKKKASIQSKEAKINNTMNKIIKAVKILKSEEKECSINEMARCTRIDKKTIRKYKFLLI